MPKFPDPDTNDVIQFLPESSRKQDRTNPWGGLRKGVRPNTNTTGPNTNTTGPNTNTSQNEPKYKIQPAWAQMTSFFVRVISIDLKGGKAPRALERVFRCRACEMEVFVCETPSCLRQNTCFGNDVISCPASFPGSEQFRGQIQCEIQIQSLPKYIKYNGSNTKIQTLKEASMGQHCKIALSSFNSPYIRSFTIHSTLTE